MTELFRGSRWNDGRCKLFAKLGTKTIQQRQAHWMDQPL
jgi:hypothetical protein